MSSFYYDNERPSRHRQSRNKNEVKSYPMQKVLIVQLMCTLLIIGFVFMFGRGETELSKGMRQLHGQIMQEEISLNKVKDVFKKAVKFTFSPSVRYEAGAESETLSTPSTENTGE